MTDTYCWSTHLWQFMSKWITFRQFPFASSSWLGLFTPAAGPPTADPTDDRHGVIVPSNLQGVPVWDEGQPAVLSLQGHLKCHEALQVRVTVEVRMTTITVRSFSEFISSMHTSNINFKLLATSLCLKLTLFSCPVELVCLRIRWGYPKRRDGEGDSPLLGG